VDVERLRALGNADELARRFFAPAEVAALAALPEAERLPGFYRLWTCKEAVLKATGEGITRGLAGVEVNCDPAASLRAVGGDRAAAAAWSLREFEPTPLHLGAVVAHQAGASFVFRTFDDTAPA
jgi:4'-phosphopantetheinyl transferase